METIFLLISLCSISLVAFLLNKELKQVKKEIGEDEKIHNDRIEYEITKYNITHKTLCKCMVTNSELHARIEKLIETYVPRRDKTTGRFITKK